jgi:two-component system LytT family response regulator
MIKCIIIDDELGAIKNLQILLAKYGSNLDLVGYATSTKEAEMKIKILKPDVIFIDIEMPGESGIDFLKRLNSYDFEVVFVTAYNEFAVQAFKLNAIDYILKPIDLHEIQHCVQRLTEINSLKDAYRKNLTKEKLDFFLHDQVEAPTKIALKNKDALELVDFSNIICLKGEGTYSEFYIQKNNRPVSIIVSYPLSHYESILPENQFVRVHKSYIVNKHNVIEVKRGANFYNIITTHFRVIPIAKRKLAEVLTQLKR